MRLSTIDIGTNTFLLLISEFDKNGVLHTIHNEQRIPRIGKNVDKDGKIQFEAFQKSVTILNEYKDISNKLNVDSIIATGTAALRDAINRIDFLEYIKNNTGIDIEIIKGEEEALWSYMGALSTEALKNFKTHFCSVIDIGGGSTEIILGNGNSVEYKISLNIGAVRITERHLKTDPPLDSEILSAKKIIQSEFSKITQSNFSESKLIGVAGTITTLAAFHQNLSVFSSDKITGYKLSYNNIEEMFRDLRVKTALEIQNIQAIPKGRADVILAGTLILMEFMKFFNIENIITSERGIRYGIAIREWEKRSIKPNIDSK